MSKRKKIFHKPEEQVPSAEDILNYLNEETTPVPPASKNAAPSPKGGASELKRNKKKKESKQESFSEEESLSLETEKKDSEVVMPSLSLSMDSFAKPEELGRAGEKERKKNKEKYALEKSMLSEPLVSEAVEGYALMGDRKRAGSLVEEINRKISQQTERKENRRAVYMRIAAILVLVFLLAGGSLVVFDQWSEVQMNTMSQKEAAPFADTISAMDNISTPGNSLALESDKVSSQEEKTTMNSNTAVQSDAFMFKEKTKDEGIAVEAEPRMEVLSEQEDRVANTMVASEKKEEARLVAPATSSNAYQWFADTTEVVQEIAKDKAVTFSRKADKGESKKEKSRAKESTSDKRSSDMFSPKVSDSEERNAMGNVKKGYLLEDGIRLYNQGSYTEAQEIFSGVLSTQPSNQEATFYRGMSAYKLNQLEPALSDLSKIIAASKRYDEARWTQSLIYEQTGRKEEAITLWKSLSKTSNTYSEQSFRKLKEYTK